MDMSAVPSVPVLGTTWVRRGPAYWWRRLLGVVGAALTAAVILAIVAAVLAGVYRTSRPLFAVGCGVLAVVMALTGWRTWRRRTDDPVTRRRDRRSFRLVVSVGAPAVVVLLLLAVLATTVFQAVIFVLLAGFAGAAAGPVLVLVARSLGREIPVERQARVALGLPAPGDPGRAAAVSALLGPGQS